jgi:hypothetical protein
MVRPSHVIKRLRSAFCRKNELLNTMPNALALLQLTNATVEQQAQTPRNVERRTHVGQKDTSKPAGHKWTSRTQVGQPDTSRQARHK